MGDIADDCFDRAMNELMDGYGDEEPDQYEGVWRSAKTPYVAATRAEVIADFESLEDDEQENDFELENALYDTIRASGWASKEATSDIVDRVLQLLAKHNYI